MTITLSLCLLFLFLGCSKLTHAQSGTTIAKVNFGASANGYQQYDSSKAKANGEVISLNIHTQPGSANKGTAENSVYSSHAWYNNSFTYEISVKSSGKYEVTLGFAEVYFCFSGAEGKRVFSAKVGGETIPGIDVYKASGCNEPLTVLFKDVTPTNGKIVVELQRRVQRPMISTIVVRAADAPAVTPTPIKIPKLLDENWTQVADYPLGVGEAQGAAVNGDLIVAGGYISGTKFEVTDAVYAYKISQSSQTWRRLANLPLAITHAAQAIVGSIMYLCGGYDGQHPGPSIKLCYKYDADLNAWSSLPSLPADRAGGGLVYISQINSLFFSSGAVRTKGINNPQDQKDSYLLNLDDVGAGWQKKAPNPNPRNHMAAIDVDGRYFFVGGQHNKDEDNGNVDSVQEYNYKNDAWIKRESMPYAAGHISASTLKYGNGFLVVAGVSNSDGNKELISTIIYYHLLTDRWHTIGRYIRTAQTPICGIANDILMCSTAGGDPYETKSSFIRRIGF